MSKKPFSVQVDLDQFIPATEEEKAYLVQMRPASTFFRDGVKRLDMLLIDYLGAEDSDYSKAVSRKFFAAAVARAMNPGTKFDYVPVLIGPQGIGKTTFVATVGQEWYSDSLQNFEGKEAAEMIQGRWINELGELAGLTRAESNTVKNFLSRREDIFRQPYGRRMPTRATIIPRPLFFSAE